MAKSSQHQYEYLLFGSVSDSDVAPLLHRLRGLCDYATTGGVPFTDRELTYKIGTALSSTKVRVRQSLDSPDAPWHLIYSGQLDLGDAQRPTGVRSFVSSSCSRNLMDFLKELGFVIITELILKGWLFRKGQMKVSVFKIYQPGDTGELESAQQVSSHYLVELSAVMASGQDEIGSNMRSFAEQLKPIVTMEKTDGSR